MIVQRQQRLIVYTGSCTFQQTSNFDFTERIKGCSQSSATLHLRWTSFCKHLTIKSLQSAETTGFEGNSIFVTFKITFSRRSVSYSSILNTSPTCVISSPNGFFPYTIW